MPETALTIVSPAPEAPALVEPLQARPLSENSAAVYLAGLAPGSRRTMQGALEVIAQLAGGPEATARSLPWHQLRFQHTQAIRARLAEKYSAATANKMLSALRGALKAAWRLGLMSAEAYQTAIDVGRVPGETLPAGRSVAMGELVALLDGCRRDAGPAGARDAALLYGCGLRRAELAALDVEGYDAAAGSLKVQGKRNKARLVPVVGGAARALEDWLRVRGDEAGPLFVRIRKGGTLLPGSRLSTQAVYHVLSVRAGEAGVAAFSPHDLRRTFVGDLLEAGADIATVQKLAGHAGVTTTARYDRRGEATKRKAAQMLHVPYHKRG